MFGAKALTGKGSSSAGPKPLANWRPRLDSGPLWRRPVWGRIAAGRGRLTGSRELTKVPDPTSLSR
jgi:hypothetical protein